MNATQDNARKLRKTQTDVERRLWQLLRNRSVAGCKFRRQHPVGPYICDFVCIDCQLVIEVDDRQHATQFEKDEARTTYLESKGFTVTRFWNHEVLTKTEAVLERIFNLISSDSPHLVPLPRRDRDAVNKWLLWLRFSVNPELRNVEPRTLNPELRNAEPVNGCAESMPYFIKKRRLVCGRRFF